MDETLATPLLFYYLYSKKKANYAIVASNLYNAEKIYESLLNYLDEDDVLLFPSDELLRAEEVSSSKELLGQRLYVMSKSLESKKRILITHPSALLRYLPPKERFASLKVSLKVGDRHDVSKLRDQLSSMGYLRVNKIDQSLQFASRGDILDIFPINSSKPVRIDFFDDEIDDIRYFDIQTQISTEHLNKIDILPASEILLNDDEIDALQAKVDSDFASMKESSFKDDAYRRINSDIEDLRGRTPKTKLYRYFGSSLKETNSILSYFSPEFVFVADKENFFNSSENIKKEAKSFYDELYENGFLPKGMSQYMDVGEALANNRVLFAERFQTSRNDASFNVRSIVTSGTGINSLAGTIKTYLDTHKKIALCLPEKNQRAVVAATLEENGLVYEYTTGYNLPERQIGISDANLNEGFDLYDSKIVYLSAKEVFGKKINANRFASHFKKATILRNSQDLLPGDFLVHEYYGIGKFSGIKTIETGGIHRDYLEILYANDEKLFVPLEQFRFVRKYSGRDGFSPRLSHLYSGDWEKRKGKIKERMSELADRLIALYGERANIKGYAYKEDDEFVAQFDQSFPYKLTDDQQVAIDEIKKDMESPSPMDRLLCGDVGFGKTELAFRAAFKAINEGKQVAFMAPTTVLARQHYEVALERFSSFGVHIDLLSRMVPSRRQNMIFDEIREGKIDLLIGTHKLLSKKLEFKNLGLLIIDEEQRFGVEQKEKIKELKKDVDVLSLSATPIPRTLQMSLVGLRSVSTINTPPETRSPIQTYVVPFNEDVVYELISRELARNGQVFYIHNDIGSMYDRASKIANRIPSASVGVIHGKLDKGEIEDSMSRFYSGEINVLVATSIVENGIDVPNANMIIVDDADRFGLSQLYQIKGRVGRGDRMAYAYLLYRPNKKMNEDATKRLKAIQDFTELGSGYKIAERDLMIRGAGDILGSEQAGFIDSIGFDLYLQLLNETVEERKTGKAKDPIKPRKLFKVDAYIPQEYANDGDKVDLYQQLEDAKNMGELSIVLSKMADIYGVLPEGVANLATQKRIEIIIQGDEFSSLEEGDGYIDIIMSQNFSKYPRIAIDLFQTLVPYISKIKVSFVDKRVRIRYLTKDDNWLDTLETILTNIDKLNSLKIKENNPNETR